MNTLTADLLNSPATWAIGAVALFAIVLVCGSQPGREPWEQQVADYYGNQLPPARSRHIGVKNAFIVSLFLIIPAAGAAWTVTNAVLPLLICIGGLVTTWLVEYATYGGHVRRVAAHGVPLQPSAARRISYATFMTALPAVGIVILRVVFTALLEVPAQ